MNSNTFQDQPGQKLSYKFGSLTHADPAVRAQAVAHNLHCIELGEKLGARSHTVWIGDGGNFPGQVHFRRALERYLESLRDDLRGAARRLPHVHRAQALRARLLLDRAQRLGHELPLREGAGAEGVLPGGPRPPRAERQHRDDRGAARSSSASSAASTSTTASTATTTSTRARSSRSSSSWSSTSWSTPSSRRSPGFDPAYMLDQSHNVTDPIESLMTSAVELVARLRPGAPRGPGGAARGPGGKRRDPARSQTLKQAFTTDVAPILAMARHRAGGAIDPVAAYRASGYRQKKAQERPAAARRRRRHRLTDGVRS